ERAMLTKDEVGFPSRIEIDDVEHRPGGKRRVSPFGAHVKTAAKRSQQYFELGGSWVDHEVGVVCRPRLTVMAAAVGTGHHERYAGCLKQSGEIRQKCVLTHT